MEIYGMMSEKSGIVSDYGRVANLVFYPVITTLSV